MAEEGHRVGRMELKRLQWKEGGAERFSGVTSFYRIDRRHCFDGRCLELGGGCFASTRVPCLAYVDIAQREVETGAE